MINIFAPAARALAQTRRCRVRGARTDSHHVAKRNCILLRTAIVGGRLHRVGGVVVVIVAGCVCVCWFVLFFCVRVLAGSHLCLIIGADKRAPSGYPYNVLQRDRERTHEGMRGDTFRRNTREWAICFRQDYIVGRPTQQYTFSAHAN